ncbi:MAG: endolytic transglycosylase MltG [Lactobacillaceae bacterium]|jgi:flagellum-specific peptidoglycan hydrolase FlgJ|nr:endolytic transglycosylase MltG [Lactobacillaceae bacterium]
MKLPPTNNSDNSSNNPQFNSYSNSQMPYNNGQINQLNNNQELGPIMQPKKKKKQNKGFIIGIAVMLLAAIGLAIHYSISEKKQEAYNKQALKAVDPNDNNYIKINFPSGSTVDKLASQLKQKELIKDSSVFYQYFVSKGDSALKAGNYYIQKSMDVPSMYTLFTTGPNTDIEKLQFIQERVNYAQEMQKKYGILTSINLAQTILESQWGKSTLASKYNNYYGIKAQSGQKSVTLQTTEFWDGKTESTVNDSFAVFDSWKQGMEEHAKFLYNGTDLKPHVFDSVIKARDYKTAAHELVVDGYATDPEYENKIIEIIETYNLSQYDNVK